MLIFIRHGAYIGEGANAELTAKGRTMSVAAGEWLAGRGLSPTRFVVTANRRTEQTAMLVREHTPGGAQREIVRHPGTVRAEQWSEIAKIAGEGGAFVGHHYTQDSLARHFGAERAPKNNRAVIYVMERTGGGWSCRDHWLGVEKG